MIFLLPSCFPSYLIAICKDYSHGLREKGEQVIEIIKLFGICVILEKHLCCVVLSDSIMLAQKTFKCNVINW